MELLLTTKDYVIRLNGGAYLKEHPSNMHWTECISQARKFMFATSAVTFATFRLNLSPSEYTVEEVGKEVKEVVLQ